MSGQLIVLFVRHGETQDNVSRILQGHRDTLLSRKGYRDASLVASKLKHQSIQAIYHSPLHRITDTINPLRSTRPSLDTFAVHDLKGQYLGKLEGRSYGEIDMDDPRSAEAVPGSNAEKFDDFVVRLKRAFGMIVGNEAPKVTSQYDRTVVIGTHGVGITALFKALENSPPCDGFNPKLAVRGPDAFEVRWPDSDDIARIAIPKPLDLPIQGGVVDWDAIVGEPFVIETWGKEEKRL